MNLRIGDIAPNFDATTTIGKINFHQWLGNSWCFFFSHPADFTPVCTTEIGKTAKLIEEFKLRNTKPLGLSTDTLEDHDLWMKDVDETQKTIVRFPLISDHNRKIATEYGMLHPGESETETVRTVFIIDPFKKIRLIMTYPMNVGRNFSEILRVIDALQIADKYHVATPADWKIGDKVVIPPKITNQEAHKLFPQGFDEIKSYLRFTKIG